MIKVRGTNFIFFNLWYKDLRLEFCFQFDFTHVISYANVTFDKLVHLSLSFMLNKLALLYQVKHAWEVGKGEVFYVFRCEHGGYSNVTERFFL